MAKSNPLVLDGGEVKLRLLAERTESKSPVHVDWVRFTCLLRNVVPTFEPLPVDVGPKIGTHWGDRGAVDELPSVLRDEVVTQWVHSTCESFALDHRDPAFLYPLQQALELAENICKALGKDFTVSREIKNGQDFYKYRWCIERAGHECAWVGFLASGDSPRQSAQANTIHANIFGHACTFADSGWNLRLADLVDECGGKVTRADLALDLFDGIPGGMEALQDEYRAGLFDVRGKTPKCSLAGDWFNGAERSLYIGCKASGKQTNVYEKGDQLFGRQSDSPWVRAELRYGNKLRVLPSDILRRPCDFFAGASDWHAMRLKAFDAAFNPQTCAQEKALPLQTVAAEVTRNIRWALTSAAPTIAAAWDFLGSEFLELVTNKKLPGRLRKFNDNDLRSAFASVMGKISTVESCGPAFA